MYRNHVPWTVIGICYVFCPIVLLIIRHILSSENKVREAEAIDTTYDDVYIEVAGKDGDTTQWKVNKVRLPCKKHLQSVDDEILLCKDISRPDGCAESGFPLCTVNHYGLFDEARTSFCLMSRTNFRYFYSILEDFINAWRDFVSHNVRSIHL